MSDQTIQPEAYRLAEVLRLVEWVSRVARLEARSETTKCDFADLRSEIRRLESKIDSLRLEFSMDRANK